MKNQLAVPVKNKLIYSCINHSVFRIFSVKIVVVGENGRAMLFGAASAARFDLTVSPERNLDSDGLHNDWMNG